MQIVTAASTGFRILVLSHWLRLVDLFRSFYKEFSYHIYDIKYVCAGCDGKESACHAGDLGLDYPLEKGMAITHASILAWRIPWAEEPGGLRPVAS